MFRLFWLLLWLWFRRLSLASLLILLLLDDLEPLLLIAVNDRHKLLVSFLLNDLILFVPDLT